MALYPCSACGQRYRGPAQAMYPAIVKGSQSDRSHLRLCGPDFQQLREYCEKHLEQAAYDGPAPQQEPLAVCCVCGGEPADKRLVFVTAYPQGQEEVQFYGEVCSRCVPVLRTHFCIGSRDGARAT